MGESNTVVSAYTLKNQVTYNSTAFNHRYIKWIISQLSQVCEFTKFNVLNHTIQVFCSVIL